MKLPVSRKVHYDSGPNLTPLVDVALVILIFMMLAGAFGTGEHYLHGEVPSTSAGAGDQGLVDEPVIVRLEPLGSGGMTAFFLDQQADSSASLQMKMSRLHERLAGASPEAARQTLILLIPDRRLPYKQTIAAYQAIRQAGFARVAFSAANEDQKL